MAAIFGCLAIQQLEIGRRVSFSPFTLVTTKIIGCTHINGRQHPLLDERTVFYSRGQHSRRHTCQQAPALRHIVSGGQTQCRVDAGTGCIGRAIRSRLTGANAVVIVVEPGIAQGQAHVRAQCQGTRVPVIGIAQTGLAAPGGLPHVAQKLGLKRSPRLAVTVRQTKIVARSAQGHARKAGRHLIDRKAFKLPFSK